MEEHPKRRVLSLSLSQQGKGRKLSRRKKCAEPQLLKDSSEQSSISSETCTLRNEQEECSRKKVLQSDSIRLKLVVKEDEQRPDTPTIEQRECSASSDDSIIVTVGGEDRNKKYDSNIGIVEQPLELCTRSASSCKELEEVKEIAEPEESQQINETSISCVDDMKTVTNLISREERPLLGYIPGNAQKSNTITGKKELEQNSLDALYSSGDGSSDTKFLCGKNRASHGSIESSDGCQAKYDDEHQTHNRLSKRNLDLKNIVIDPFSKNLSPPFHSSNNEVTDTEPQVKLQCPLCWKMFEKQQTQVSHMKSCASKKGLSTKTLLEALELQQKQAAERRALGLPSLPSVTSSLKKTSASKKAVRNTGQSDLDSNLQLALALSLSLQNGRQEQTREESGSREEEKIPSLDTFGFTSKPVLVPVNSRVISSGPRGKGKVKITPVLLTRTADERQRIVTEKVAMILMEEADVNVQPIHDSSISLQPESNVLQEYYNKEKKLWVKSSMSPSKVDKISFYVDELRDFVSPSNVDAGSKVLHISQLPCRIRTPPRNQKDEEEKSVILTSDSCSSSPSESITLSKSGHCLSSSSTSRLEMELRAKLFSDWAGLVNNSAMSDVVIYPREGRDIPAHKIVLGVRCPNILKDVVKQQNSVTGNAVEVVLLSEVPHAAALAFLEYIYCGSVKSIPNLIDDLSGIYWLAKHYNVIDLLKYLRLIQKKTCESKSQTPSISQGRSSVKRTLDVGDGGENRSTVMQDNVVELCSQQQGNRLRESLDMFNEASASPPQASGNESIYSQQTIARSGSHSRSGSPDLFENDISEESSSPQQEQNLDRLVSLIDKMRTFSSQSRESSIKAPNDVGSLEVNCTFREVLERKSLPLSPPSPALSVSSAVTEKIDYDDDLLPPTFREQAVPTDGLRLSSGSKRKHSSTSSSQSCSELKRQRSEPDGRNEALGNQVQLLDLTQDSESDVEFPIISERFSNEGCTDKVNALSPCSDASLDKCFQQNINFGETESIHIKIDGKDTILEAVDGKGVLSTSEKKVCPLEKNKKENIHRNNEGMSEERRDEIEHISPVNRSPHIETSKESMNCPSSEDYGEPYISPVWDGFEDINYDIPFVHELSPTSNAAIGGTHRMNLSPRPGSPSVDINSGVMLDGKYDEQLKLTSVGKNSSSAVDQSGSSSDGDITPFQIPAKNTNHKNKPDISIRNLLDDSLNDALSASILQRAEKEPLQSPNQRETEGTPVNRVLRIEEDAVTPLANYSAMKTPQLKRELLKYGLKPSLGKRKGKLMLRHIYNELHPWVPIENPSSVSETIHLSQTRHLEQDCRSLLPLSQPSMSRNVSTREQILPLLNSNDQESSDKARRVWLSKRTSESTGDDASDSQSEAESSSSDRNIIQESRFLEEVDEEFELLSQGLSQQTCKEDLSSVVFNFIMSDKDLHQKVLLYEPIWIEELRANLKKNGFKFKMADLMGYLDEQSGPRTKKTVKKKREAIKQHGLKSKGESSKNVTEVED